LVQKLVRTADLTVKDSSIRGMSADTPHNGRHYVRVGKSDVPGCCAFRPGVDPVLRTMTVTDLDALLVVQREGATAGLANIFPQEKYPFPTDAVRHLWEQEMVSPNTDCFVILGSEHRVKGFAAVRGNEFLHFGTAVETWGSGLAGRAHDEVLAYLSAQGHQQAWLRVLEANHRAQRFYQRRGWSPTGGHSQEDFPPYPVLLRYEVHLGTHS
jgi:RimJ/RimL family protein N-acetyltransferase